MFEKIKDYYDQGLWGEPRVRGMVIRRILTPEEYGSIIGEPIGEWVPDDGTMKGATEAADGKKGFVPAPEKGSPKRFLNAGGIWTPADGGDADTIDTFHASQGNIAETAVVRGADGSVQVGRIISDTPNNENVNISQVIVNDGTDGQYRKASLGHLKSSLDVVFFYSNSWHTNSNSYRKIMTLRTTQYNDAVTTFTVSTRGSNYRRFAVCWNDSANDPGVRYFRCTPNFSHYSNKQAMVYVAKSSAEYWDFYVEQSAWAWDNIKVSLLHRYPYVGGAVFKDESVSTLPEGYITPTEVAYIP